MRTRSDWLKLCLSDVSPQAQQGGEQSIHRVHPTQSLSYHFVCCQAAQQSDAIVLNNVIDTRALEALAFWTWIRASLPVLSNLCESSKLPSPPPPPGRPPEHHLALSNREHDKFVELTLFMRYFCIEQWSFTATFSSGMTRRSVHPTGPETRCRLRTHELTTPTDPHNCSRPVDKERVKINQPRPRPLSAPKEGGTQIKTVCRSKSAFARARVQLDPRWTPVVVQVDWLPQDCKINSRGVRRS